MTQRLKLEPSPISQTHVAKVFSPVCECDTHAAAIDFTLRRADHLRIAVLVGGRTVTIANREFRRGAVHVAWNGRGATGSVVPDGVYYPVVHLQRAGRTIDLPNPIRVDTVPPTIAFLNSSTSGKKTIFRYRTSEPAHALLFVNGRRRIYTYSTRRLGRLALYGRLSATMRLVLAAEDLAGNRSVGVPVG